MKHLVVTTRSDLSVEQLQPFTDVLFLEELHGNNPVSQEYASVYFRSHFSRPATMPQNFAAEIDMITEQFVGQDVYFVDHVTNVEAILAIEDKWSQYQLLGEYMPETYLASESPLGGQSLIFKKRLSSRASGIAWSRDEISGDLIDWIVQPRLEILEELRIYAVRGVICPMAAVRQSKTENQKVKVTELRPLSNEEIAFAEHVCSKIPQLDFVGLDVVVTPEGPALIEVNRSPDFAAFTKIADANLAEQLYETIRTGKVS